MDYKEKASELYDFGDDLYCQTCEEYPEMELTFPCHEQKKMITNKIVDEIIKAQYIDLENMFDTDFAIANIRNQSKDWQEVKAEIQKL